MKKKIFGGLCVLAIAAMTAFNVNMNLSNNQLSLLSLENVEALAGEDGKITISDWFPLTLKCYTDKYSANKLVFLFLF